MGLFLGPAARPDDAVVGKVVDEFRASLEAWGETGNLAHLFSAAAALLGIGGWEDARASGPWATAAAVVLRTAREGTPPGVDRRRLLELGEDLLGAPWMRLRAITPKRILEGLVCRRLATRE